jgi:predicted metalloprotease with PDZ domain
MLRRVLAAGLLAAALTLPARAADLTVHVDARETARGILHVKQTFRVTPGPFAITYPSWLPGEHAPTGPNVDVAGLFVEAKGQRLAWRRDGRDVNTLRFTVPAGVSSVDLRFDFLLENGTDGYTSAACSTPNLLLLSWNQVTYYPAGRRSDAVTCEASLTLPDGWQHATALEPALGAPAGEVIRFAACDLTTLVDSPVLAGRHFRTVDLGTSGGAPVRLRMACDSEAGLAIPDSEVDKLRALVREADSLFGARHFRHYDFLVTLSDHTAHFGLEHHQSSDDRVPERTFIDGDLRLRRAGLLPHEYVHSWNGKFRRPTGLATGDYHTPMQGEMLWVYEGLTSYLGLVLTARSGLRTPEQSRDDLAVIAASIEANRGREWRPLFDTGVHAQELYSARDAWAAWRRGVDFYDEGVLVWLDVDVTLRRLTKGRRTLDDFCRVFHGGANRGAELKPYGLDEIVAILNGLQPYAWRDFLEERVYRVAPHAPVGGITAGGWNLVWADSLGPVQKAQESVNGTVVEDYSLGFTLSGSDGRVRDLIPGSPADRAGVAPDMKVVAVNGRRFSKDVLRDAVTATRQGAGLELLLENKEFFRTVRLDWREGRRHPALSRENGLRDHLGEVLAPRSR